MARIQILELPEGAGDDRPPFALVIDQYEPPRYITAGELETGTPFDGVAEKTGARAVLVFTESVEIPANETRHEPGAPADPKAQHYIGAPEWCCGLAFQTLGQGHFPDCPRKT